MKYLLDTHALLWYLFDNDNLSLAAKNIIDSEFCYYSKVSLWEIAIKQTRNLLQ
ncbi:MAG: PIN domain-containing protein, partial [Spirochaetales bacterium]|nr:PIN domain-containing protein [Spirochaetales bacterium]